jgi:hypothetical protein
MLSTYLASKSENDYHLCRELFPDELETQYMDHKVSKSTSPLNMVDMRLPSQFKSQRNACIPRNPFNSDKIWACLTNLKKKMYVYSTQIIQANERKIYD